MSQIGCSAKVPSMKAMAVVLGVVAVLASCKANLAHSSYDGGDTEAGMGGTPGAGGSSGNGGAPGTGGTAVATGGAPGSPDGSATASGGRSNESTGSGGTGSSTTAGAGGALADAGMDAPGGAGAPGAGGTNGGGAGSGGAGGAASQTDAGPPCVPECPGGATCRAGTCVCFEDMALCGGYCVDIRSARTHCGNCATTCDGGCSAGRCYEVVAKGSGLPAAAIAITATYIYLGNRDQGTLSRMPRNGGTATVLATGEYSLGRIAVDTDTLYWTRSVKGGGICKMPLSGGACTLLVASDEPSMIALDATNVYWSTREPYSVNKVPKKGGGVTVIASGDNANSANNLVTDDKNLYWTSSTGGGTVFEIPLIGGTVVALAKGISAVDNGPYFAVTGGNVYVFDAFGTGSERLVAIDSRGGAAMPLVNTRVIEMVADDGAIYMEQSPRNVMSRFDLDTGIVTELAQEEESSVWFMAVEGDDFFWQNAAGDIKSTPKKP